MSTFITRIPTQIKIKGHIFFFNRKIVTVGNAKEAQRETNRLREENPGMIIRRNDGTISEYI